MSTVISFIGGGRSQASIYSVDHISFGRSAVSFLLAGLATYTACSAVVGPAKPTIIAYAAVVLVVFGNELVVAPWRSVRDRALSRVEDDQMIEDRRRVGEG